jgi:hypothetical protein
MNNDAYLAKLANCTPEEWTDHRDEVLAQFPVMPDGYRHNNWLDGEVTSAQEISSIRREAAKQRRAHGEKNNVRTDETDETDGRTYERTNVRTCEQLNSNCKTNVEQMLSLPPSSSPSDPESATQTDDTARVIPSAANNAARDTRSSSGKGKTNPKNGGQEKTDVDVDRLRSVAVEEGWNIPYRDHVEALLRKYTVVEIEDAIRSYGPADASFAQMGAQMPLFLPVVADSQRGWGIDMQAPIDVSKITAVRLTCGWRHGVTDFFFYGDGQNESVTQAGAAWIAPARRRFDVPLRAILALHEGD